MNVKNYVRALLCLYFIHLLSAGSLAAQGLKTGDSLPPELWNLPLKVLNHPEGKETITLNEYKGKLIILDFWATWCAPCVAMLPKMDSLQKELAGQVQIIPLTYQGRKEVREFMDKYTRRTGREIALPKVIEEKALHRAFPHIYIPHYVWITPDGTVKAITGHEEITAEKVRAVLSSGEARLTTKADPAQVVYDSSRPFLVNGNGGDGSNLVYQSVLTSYTPGLSGGYSIQVDNQKNGRLSLLNVPLYWYYRAAYGADSVWFGKNRVEIQMAKPERVFYSDTCGSYEEWKKRFAYCYQLALPETDRGGLFDMLKADLRRLFPEIDCRIEAREKLCWVLARIPGRPAPAAGSGESVARMESRGYTLRNALLSTFISDMNIFLLQDSPLPLVDETHLTEKVNLEIYSKLNDMEKVSSELGKYGLQITQEKRKISVLVLRDKREQKL